MRNKLKIIGGKWRSRTITFADIPNLRPTPARVRETLFNWLPYNLVGKSCLDLYAGSGALGFEAASRGANKIVQVENNASAVNALATNKALLAADAIQITQNDVVLFLQEQAECFDLVFIDPPFASKLIAQTCFLLEQHGWLATTTKIYIEAESHQKLTNLPKNWQCLKQKQAGKVGYQLFSHIV